MKCIICNKERKNKLVDGVCQYCKRNQLKIEKYGSLENFKKQKDLSIIEKYGSLENFYKVRQESKNRRYIEQYGSIEAGKEATKKKKEDTCFSHFGKKCLIADKQFRDEHLVPVLQKEETKEKRRQTSMERYGDETFNNRKKYKETLENNPEIIEKQTAKTKATKFERYGNETYVNPEQAKETCLKRYGVTSYQKTEESKRRHSNWYNNLSDEEKLELKRKRSSKRWLYDGIYFDSFWEIEFYVFHKDHGHRIIYEPCALEYKVDGKIHRYYPDFEVDGKLFELKSERLLNEDKTDLKAPPKQASMQSVYSAKFQCMKDNNVTLISNDEIIPYEKYIKYKYGSSLKKSCKN